MAEPLTSNYPTSADNDTSLGGDAVALKSFVLSNNILATDTSIATNGSLATINFPVYWLIDSELMYVPTHSGDTGTGVIRGVGGTTATSHASGRNVACVIAPNMWNQLKRAIVAVETDLISNGHQYILTARAAQFSPADATTYYMGVPDSVAPGTVANIHRIYTPRAGTISKVNIQFFNNGGTQGSAETFSAYIRVNNTTDNLISSTLKMDMASNGANFYAITGLSIAMANTDYFEIKIVAPTWVTNPTNVATYFQVYIS